LNVFNIWSELFPNHREEIERVRAEVEPHWEVLRNFRDKCGFHADTPRNYFLAKQKMLENSSQVAKAVQHFLDLAKLLIVREEEELPDFVPEVENFLLDFELEEGNYGIKRGALKKLLILPRTKYRQTFS
jgi:hypothetical protein